MTKDQIALQLYTLREATGQDMIGTLKKLQQIGFRYLEFAGFGNATPRELEAVLPDLGMKAIAAHTPISDFEASLSQTLDRLHALGVEYAVVPWIAPDMRNADFFAGLTDNMNRWAEQARSEGIQLAYHNHDFEFAPQGDTNFFEMLVGSTDANLVKLEFDVYWASFAGQDPVEIIKRHADRMRLLHMKDMGAGTDKAISNVGEGVIDFKAIIQAGDRAGVEWYVIENDFPKDPFNDVEKSLRHLEQLAS